MGGYYRYAGTLPLGEVYRYEGGTQWTLSACVDDTPDVIYRRAWSMAVHDGQLHVGTLPSGKVWYVLLKQAYDGSYNPSVPYSPRGCGAYKDDWPLHSCPQGGGDTYIHTYIHTYLHT